MTYKCIMCHFSLGSLSAYRPVAGSCASYEDSIEVTEGSQIVRSTEVNREEIIVVVFQHGSTYPVQMSPNITILQVVPTDGEVRQSHGG